MSTDSQIYVDAGQPAAAYKPPNELTPKRCW
jgi:hypothetical protein